MDACTVFGTSALSYTKNGSPIDIGKAVDRLHFAIIDKSLTRFDIPYYNEEPKDIKTVLISIGKDLPKVYMDVDECAMRLHLKTEKIVQSDEKGQLIRYWRRKTNKIKLLNAVINHFEDVCKNYDEGENKDYLIPKDL